MSSVVFHLRFQQSTSCMKAPGMSTVATSLSSLASIMHVRIRPSALTVGDLVSSLVLYTRCFRPSAQPRPLIRPQRFFLRNIRYSRALFFSSRVNRFALLGSTTFRFNMIIYLTCVRRLKRSLSKTQKVLI